LTLSSRRGEAKSRASINQSINQAVQKIEGTYARIDKLETKNLQLDTEVCEARNARRRAEDLRAHEARTATAALKALEDYNVANPPRGRESLNEDSRTSNVDSPLKPKHKAHRSDVHQDSPSQLVPELSSLRPVTPRSSFNDFDEELEDDDQPLQVEGSQETPHGAAAAVSSTASGSRRTAPVLPDSQPSQPRGPPRSILKSSRPIKRSAEAAGLPTAKREPRRRGGLHAESQGLGPVIPESQSQNGAQSQARSRRLLKPAAPKPKGGLFMFFEGNR